MLVYVSEALRRSSSTLEAVQVDDNVDDREMWDNNLAQCIVGKVVLVGLTCISADGAVSDQQQFFGTAVSADRAKAYC